MKKILLALPMLLVACASAPVPGPTTVDIPLPAAQVDQSPLQVAGATWNLTAPSGWSVRSHEKQDGQENAIAIGSINGKPAALIVSTVTLDSDIPDAVFGQGALVAMERAGAKILDAKPATVSGKPGSASIWQTPNGEVVFQYAVGSNRTGYIVACGGHLDVPRLQKCKTILDTFRLK